MKKLFPLLLILVSVGLFISIVKQTHEKIGQSFPGYLAFENNVVGAFYVPDWPGHTQGMKYHTIVNENQSNTGQDVERVFTYRDYVLTCILPAVTGLLFLLLGMGLCMYIPNQQGRIPLLFLHVLIGNYLILTPDFHVSHQFSALLMVVFALIPATAIHFSLLFPENTTKARNHPSLYWMPYVISFLLMIPYVGFFHHPRIWVRSEYTVFFYLVMAYLFWVSRLYQTLKHPQLESNRIIARYLLLGQIIAFIIPLATSLSIFVGNYSFPLNFAAPFSLLFPISLFLGVILARLRQSQIQLIQSEKRAALGNLLAGLAHEINNPMTFIYSAIEPLRESVVKLKSSVTDEAGQKEIANIDEISKIMEEGSIRAKNIIDHFRFFSFQGQSEKKPTDIHELIDQSLRLLQPKWKDRIRIIRNFGDVSMVSCVPVEMGQVLINILSNACYAIPNEGTIEISTHVVSKNMQISVRDSGKGMTKEVMSKIFDPFYTTKDQGEGTGLGLAITFEIIKKHHGSIDVTSEVGKGTEFVIMIPME